ncbi:MAG: OmpA family protein [Acidobacteriota bacterium]|jgi:outer membrane protein OmpA-like peptidoglycan-associated protein
MHRTAPTPVLVLVIPALLALGASGCATKDYVRSETGAVHSRVDSVEKQVEQNQTALRDTNDRVTRTEEEVTEVSRTAREALERAEAAGKLAEGKLLYETVLTDSDVRFAFDKAELSEEARAALEEFATDLKSRFKDVYIEIQGHTDAVGTDEYNDELGLERAEAVRLYLNREHGLPLHRMSVISYGESAPIADNDTREGRAQNRRVVLVVLQ